ncbi:MAG: hypothetical protein ACREA0_04575 [bacterium]
MVFPGLLLLVLAIKLGSEFYRRSSLGALFYFDAMAFMAITISTVLYLSLVHLRR